MEILKTLYGAIGAPYPWLSMIIVFFVGGGLSAAGWWLIGLQYGEAAKKKEEKIVQPTANKDPGFADNPQRNRPTAIHVEGGSNIIIRNNVGIGDMDLIRVKDVENLDAQGNALIDPKSK